MDTRADLEALSEGLEALNSGTGTAHVETFARDSATQVGQYDIFPSSFRELRLLGERCCQLRRRRRVLARPILNSERSL